MKTSINKVLLECVIQMCHYFSVLSEYKKELIIHIPHTFSNISLSDLTLDILQISIVKLKCLRLIDESIKKQASLDLTHNEISSSIIVNKLLQIIWNCVNVLMNYIPSMNDLKFNTNIEQSNEFNLLISLKFTAPSYDTLNTQLSFGSLLFIIDYCIKTLHKLETLNRTLSSPSKAKSEAISIDIKSLNK
jgi:hypothetical protein